MKYLKQLVICFLLIFAGIATNAQVLGIQNFGTSGHDSRPFCSQAADKGVVTVWASKAPGQKSKLMVRKTNNLGNEMWKYQIFDSTTLNAPDLTPVSIIIDNNPNSQGEIYVLANANYNSAQINNDIYFFKLNSSGNFISSRRLMADNASLGLSPNAVNTLVAYSIIQLKNGSNNGDFLIAANLAAGNNNAFPIPGIAPKVTQILFKIRPDLSLNWGRQICFGAGVGNQSFPQNSRNATYQVIEKPNGNIMMSGWRAVGSNASRHLITEITVSSAGLSIVNDNWYQNTVAGDFAGHSITQNLSNGNLYTSYYGLGGTNSMFTLHEFNQDGTNYIRSNHINAKVNKKAPFAKLLYYNSTSLLFVSLYDDSVKNQLVLGSLNPITNTINWAKTFPLLNNYIDSFNLTYEIMILDNGDILLSGDYKSSINNRDIALITTLHGPASGNCELAVDLNITNRNVNPRQGLVRSIDNFEKPQWRTPKSSFNNVTSILLCGCPYTSKDTFIYFCQLPGKNGVFFQPCNSLYPGEKYTLKSLTSEGNGYDSKIGYWAGGVHITGCISHYLIPGKYVIKFLDATGCVTRQLIVNVVGEAPALITTSEKFLYYCGTPGADGLWVNPCDVYKSVFGLNSLPQDFMYTVLDQAPGRTPTFNSEDWVSQNGGNGCISMYMKTGIHELSFYDKSLCVWRKIIVYIQPTTPTIASTIIVNKTFCGIPGVTGMWVNPCDVYVSLYGMLPSNFMYTTFDMTNSGQSSFNSDEYKKNNGGDGCISHFMKIGYTEVDFYDKTNCTVRKITINVTPDSPTLTDSRTITKTYCSLTSSGRWINPCTIYEEIYGPNSLPANFMYTSLDNQTPPRSPEFNSDAWVNGGNGSPCIALFMENGSYTVKFYDKDACTYKSITVNIVDNLNTIVYPNPFEAYFCIPLNQGEVNLCDLFKNYYANPPLTLPADFSYTLTDISLMPTMPPFNSDQLPAGNKCPNIILNEGTYSFEFMDKTTCTLHKITINMRKRNCSETNGIIGDEQPTPSDESNASPKDVSNANGHSSVVKPTSDIINNVKLYPNPGTGVFKIQCSSTKTSETSFNIEILDINGKCIFQNKDLSINVENTIDVSSIANGVYIVKVIQGDSIKVLKYVKN